MFVDKAVCLYWDKSCIDLHKKRKPQSKVNCKQLQNCDGAL